MCINSVEHLKKYLRRAGYEIVDQDKQHGDVRPYLITWHRKSDTMIYVDLRVYESRPAHIPRLWYRNWMHRIHVRNSFRRWLRTNKWRGNHQFDVVTVFPPIGYDNYPIIDYITNVKM